MPKNVVREVNRKDWLAQKLREDKEFASILLRNAPNPIWIAKADTSLVYVNPALEKLSLFTLAEVLGKKPPYPWWTEETMEKSKKDWQEAIRKGLTRREELFKKKNEERFWVEVTSTSVKKDGKLAYYLSSWVDITEQKRLRENIQSYITQITKAQEEERRRIARELHDDTVQELASICVEIGKTIMMKEKGEDAFVRLRQVPIRIERLVEELRRFSHDLRPGLLDKFGMISSIELLVDELQIQDDLDCRIEVVGNERRLSPDIETVLFRIVQEALCNARKHSDATSVLVKISFKDTKVTLTINDNGCGFKVPRVLSNLARDGKLGLMGMKERARLVGAELSVKSRLDKGTTVKVTI